MRSFFLNVKSNKYTASLDDKSQKNNQKGQVYIIGAGVGDIELLTLKAHRLLQTADVIMVDWLVNKDLYQYFGKYSEVLFVGKKCGQHSMEQKKISELLLSKALQGNTVVRLKGGDPSIFGRLGEETDILTKHGINFAIVPGVTAATGCAAYSGIPLTHRACAQSVRFITASLKNTEDEAKWSSLASGQDTLVFYMGLNKVEQISQRLIEYGMRCNMPIAIIDQGTLTEQQVVCATLITINDEKLKRNLIGPAIIIVGEVVDKRQSVDLELLSNRQVNS
jgi:uroporphyrin-III C-methyltransferase